MKRKYDDEFKRNAVNNALDNHSVRSVSRELIERVLCPLNLDQTLKIRVGMIIVSLTDKQTDLVKYP